MFELLVPAGLVKHIQNTDNLALCCLSQDYALSISDLAFDL